MSEIEASEAGTSAAEKETAARLQRFDRERKQEVPESGRAHSYYFSKQVQKTTYVLAVDVSLPRRPSI